MSSDSKPAQSLGQAAKSFKIFLLKCVNDWSLTLSAAVAYTLLLSLFPIAMVLLSILGLVLGRLNQAAATRVLQGIAHALPGQLQSTELLAAVAAQLQGSSGLFALIAVLSSLFFGAQFFVVLETCFSLIYHVRPRPLLRQQVIALAMFLLFVLLVPIMVFTSSMPTLVVFLLQEIPLGPLPFLPQAAGPLGRWLASFLFFECIYVVVPNLHIRLHEAALGALVAALALQLYFALFPLYAAFFLTSLSGLAGWLALLLIFFYYVAMIFFLGAEVNAFFVAKVQPMPNDLVSFVTTLAGTLNQDIPIKEAQIHVDTQPTEQAMKEHTGDGVTNPEAHHGETRQ